MALRCGVRCATPDPHLAPAFSTGQCSGRGLVGCFLQRLTAAADPLDQSVWARAAHSRQPQRSKQPSTKKWHQSLTVQSPDPTNVNL